MKMIREILQGLRIFQERASRRDKACLVIGTSIFTTGCYLVVFKVDVIVGIVLIALAILIQVIMVIYGMQGKSKVAR